MKKLLATAMALVLAATSYAQLDVTRFLGIPVDGTKAEMIEKLKAKGFRSNAYDREALEGEFNGSKVYLAVVTNNNKVCRIVVVDVNNVGETDIRIRFNQLCRQFENNSRYVSFRGEQTLEEDEDISYEMSVHDKRYEAVFYQKASEEQQSESDTTVSVFDRSVWFKISESYGKYYITMFYDNELNRANGEDL